MIEEHMEDDRLIEIAISASIEISAAEASHLAACARCSRTLEEEKRLSALLTEIAPTRLSGGFREGAMARFAAASRAAARRQIFISLSLLAVLGAATIVAIALQGERLVADLAVLAGELAAALEATKTLAAIAPTATTISLSVLCLVAVFACLSLAALARRWAPVKYPARRGVRPMEETR